MKKIMNLVYVTFLSISMFSCKKENLSSPESNAAQPASKISATPATSTNRYLPSDWFSVNLRVVEISFDKAFLLGEYMLPPQFTQKDNVHLAYSRVLSSSGNSATDSYTYRQIPAVINTASGLTHMNFSVSSTAFTLTITSEILLNTPNISDFKNYEYRHIIIPRSDYQTMQVDWSNYRAVAAALNFPL